MMECDRPWRFIGIKTKLLGDSLKAKVSHQNYADEFAPLRRYVGVQIRCRLCSCDFIFSAKEQKYWYEELGFWIDSVPRECPKCRKILRTKKNIQIRLGKLTTLEKLSNQEKREFLELTNQLCQSRLRISQKFRDKTLSTLKIFKTINLDVLKKELLLFPLFKK